MTVTLKESQILVPHQLRYRVRIKGNTITVARNGTDLDSAIVYAIRSAVGPESTNCTMEQALKSIEITLEESV